MDRRMEAIAISPDAFLKKRGDKNVKFPRGQNVKNLSSALDKKI